MSVVKLAIWTTVGPLLVSTAQVVVSRPPVRHTGMAVNLEKVGCEKNIFPKS